MSQAMHFYSNFAGHNLLLNLFNFIMVHIPVYIILSLALVPGLPHYVLLGRDYGEFWWLDILAFIFQHCMSLVIVSLARPTLSLRLASETTQAMYFYSIFASLLTFV